MGNASRSKAVKADWNDLSTYKHNDSKSKTLSNKTGIGEFLSNSDVKEFNRRCREISFSRFNYLESKIPLLADYDRCKAAIMEYFEDCEECNVAPTPSGLALYLDCDVSSLYRIAKLKEVRSTPLIRKALQITQVVLEQAAVGGKLPPILYIFLATNYYGMKDARKVDVQTNISVEEMVQGRSTTAATMEALQAQVLAEQKEVKVLEKIPTMEDEIEETIDYEEVTLDEGSGLDPGAVEATIEETEATIEETEATND